MQMSAKCMCFLCEKLLFCLMLSLLILSCTQQNAEQEPVADDPVAMQPDNSREEQQEDENYNEGNEEAESTDSSNGSDAEDEAIESPAAMLPPPDNREEYRVIMGADSLIKLPGLPGELRVWIGDSSYSSNMSARMERDTANIPAVGEWATVKPFAPGFQIEPPETQCITIHPSGSEVVFELIPERSGIFEVGVTVNLYNSSTCSGSPIPKTAANLLVTVEVDRAEKIKAGLLEFWNMFWVKLLEFWGGLLALFFGLILFLIRGRLKRWFGFESREAT